MENTKHTQGDWSVYRQANNNETKIGISSNDKGTTHVIAFMTNYDPSNSDRDHEWTLIAEANAKLMASAPKLLEQVTKLKSDKETLLEALKECKVFLHKYHNKPSEELEFLKLVDNAIAKATKPMEGMKG